MFKMDAAEILFFLWSNEKVSFKLPAEKLTVVPTTYFATWDGAERFFHNWTCDNGDSWGPQKLSLVETMNLIKNTKGFFRIRWLHNQKKPGSPNRRVKNAGGSIDRDSEAAYKMALPFITI